MNLIFFYISMSLAGVSTVLNILYLADRVGETWISSGFIAAAFSGVILNFLNLVKTRRKNKGYLTAKEDDTNTLNASSKRMAFFFITLLFLIWGISYLVALRY